MKEKITVLSFSGIYDYESFYLEDKGSFNVLRLEKINGTNCMCDDIAKEEILSILTREQVSPYAMHFIDSGNYHYMSYLLTGLIDEPFSLVVLDHHPDMQPPMFGDILSCGGWVKEVLDRNKNVRDIHIIGADRKLIEQLDAADRDRVFFYDLMDIFGDEIRLPATEYPVYLSIDKDVVTRSELVTNWDQGEFTSNQLIAFTGKICSDRELLGIDVCGECAKDQEECDIEAAIRGNDAINKAIVATVREKAYNNKY